MVSELKSVLVGEDSGRRWWDVVTYLVSGSGAMIEGCCMDCWCGEVLVWAWNRDRGTRCESEMR